MKRKPKSQRKQVAQEPNALCIVIEFAAPKITDPNIYFGKSLSLGQLRDAAGLLNAMVERYTQGQITLMQQKEQEQKPKIIVPRGALQ